MRFDPYRLARGCPAAADERLRELPFPAEQVLDRELGPNAVSLRKCIFSSKIYGFFEFCQHLQKFICHDCQDHNILFKYMSEKISEELKDDLQTRFFEKTPIQKPLKS